MTALHPLLTPSPLPHKAPPFDQVKEGDYLPAAQDAIRVAEKRVQEIKTNPATPTFENTIVALETCAEELSMISALFYNQLSAAGNDALQALADKIGPLSANFSTDLMLDTDLFARVRAVYDRRAEWNLTPAQATLLQETYDGFVRNGALLQGPARNRLRAINERLSVLGPTFANNVVKAAETFTLILTDPADVAGLPTTALALAQEEAKARGHENAWCITLDAPSYMPFITYAQNRALREKIWHAFSRRGFEAPFDNAPLAKETLALRAERATLLGYKTSAHYILEKRMAKTPAEVFAFLDRMRGFYKPAAEKDLQALRDFAQKTDGLSDLKPWDVAYYGEKLKESLFHFSSEELRPYFPLDVVLRGTFEHFSKLFDITFEPAPAYPVWHPDVRAYDVRDRVNNRFLGLFYADFFPRPGSKKEGAWQTDYRGQGLFAGQIERPIVAIVCNFTKPTADQPSLLTFDEVLTLFHEMGHALHNLLAEGDYPSICGTSVRWDFVELPSQIQENWLLESETLALVSRHHKTGHTLPSDLIQKLREAQNFMAGWAGLRQMAFSFLDMTLHSLSAPPDDLAAFEDETLKDWLLFPRLGGTISTSFSHVFAGGYAAGYYSYKWAEVLDADAFELFLDRGLYDRATAQSYRTEILAKGGTEPPDALYKRFRGRAPDPEALLRREGLLKDKHAA